MTAAYAPRARISPLSWIVKQPRDTAQRECEPSDGVCPVAELRAALAREAALRRERDALIEQHATLRREADHRFLNNLQMVSSLLLMQSRASVNAETASAFAFAAGRVAMIGRIHRHLHSNDGVESVAFKRFIEELCHDVIEMLSPEECAARAAITVEGVELQLPAAIAIPLGFTASELITNALKHGNGPITVRLAPDSRQGFLLSVENAGHCLPDRFDPADSKGLGMRIIRSFVEAIGGELAFGRGENNRGARFEVLFAAQGKSRILTRS